MSAEVVSPERRLRRVARRLSALEPAFVILAAPFLLFPTFRPACTVGALAVLLLVWLLGWLGTGQPGIPTPLDGSLLLLALTIPVAVWASAVMELTLPKLTGLILGLATFRATVNAGHKHRGLWGATSAFLALGLGLMTFGLVGTAWVGKLPGLEPVLARIPRLVQGLPGAEMGINANELGGAVILFLPVSLALCLFRVAGRRGMAWAVRLTGVLLSLFFGVVLVLTQSRSAWMGAVAGLATMAWVRWPWTRWVILGLALVLALGLWTIGPSIVVQTLFPAESQAAAGAVAGISTLEGRLEVWNRALSTIQDFSFTGPGLGTFRRVVHLLYPLFLASPDGDVGHAHNVFLQVALDLGLPGLVAYLALVGTALWLCWRTAWPAGSPYQWLALGIAGSLVAFHIYGLTDTIALGAKPGVALWMLLALAAVLWSIRSQVRQGSVELIRSVEEAI
jgi:putative inorganic carbon (HCO3(-)) transporter